MIKLIAAPLYLVAVLIAYVIDLKVHNPFLRYLTACLVLLATFYFLLIVRLIS